MAQAKLFEEIDQRMREIFSRSPAADLEKNLRALLASTFSRLDLVTREEFDVQREVLARTRAKLEELEAKLAELEKMRLGRRQNFGRKLALQVASEQPVLRVAISWPWRLLNERCFHAPIVPRSSRVCSHTRASRGP